MTSAGTTGRSKVDSPAIRDLRSRVRGEVLTAEDPGFDDVRRVWNALIDRRPGAIIRCTGAADVMAAITIARERELLVAIRGGGHNVAGASVCDDGLVIDLSAMRGIRVDPNRRTAQAQGGVTWGDLDHETQRFGLAAPGGVVSTTGIAGLTLGGGLGWLRSKYGLSCDNLLSVDIVTADGQFRSANERENSDLFWGIRGGGGNFGVVTSFGYQLHAVGPEVMLCVVAYPLGASLPVLRSWRDFMASAPDEFSSQAYLWSVPDHDSFPAAARGNPAVVIAGMYAGPADEGERFVRPLRDLGPVLADLSQKCPYTAAQTMFDPFVPKGRRYYFKSTNLTNLDDAVLEIITTGAMKRPVPSVLLAIWHYGGVLRRRRIEDSAFASRDTPFLFSVDGIWDRPEDSDRVIAWSRALVNDMQAHSSGGMYVNFPGFAEEGDELIRASYSSNYERLVALKNKYDPGNLFRMNLNIKPTV
jgi:FAD/FMN-containing dehydrogenase